MPSEISKPTASLIELKSLQIKVGEQVLVEPLSFSLAKGKSLAIVGESGSGKSLTSLAIMGLLSPQLSFEGDIIFKGQSLSQLSEEDRQQLRGAEIAMIFQEPMSALNPSMTCGKQTEEILAIHTDLDAKARREKVLALFKRVELPRIEEIYEQYPHQLSGGQKQRVMIAMAMACEPSLLIADEPTTALDVSVQAEILKLMRELQEEREMSMIFISHDLGVVRQVADEVLVLHQGKLKEHAASEQIFKAPQDLYTRGLLACRPQSDKPYRRLPLVRDFLAEDLQAMPLQDLTQKNQLAKARMRMEPLFEVKNLVKVYRSKAGILGKTRELKALHEVNLKVYPGESLGLVGESGSGKSTIGRLLVGLEQSDGGEIYFKGKEISKASKKDWRQLHRSIQIIFQDPFASLNPRMPIGEAIAEVLRLNRRMTAAEARAETETLLEKVGLLREYYARYPHEFSGGQRQRIGIARALAMQPEFIVCDESVSALDVSVQAQILNLLNDLQEEFGFTYLFIAHDLQVVRYFCDRVLVLEKGRLVEEGLAEELYHNPQEEYTQKLLKAAIE